MTTHRIWIASYGGSGTNWLNNALAARDQAVDRDWWGPGPCHAPAPICDAPCTAAVYIYRHPRSAYLSQHRRGLHHVNQRKMGTPGPRFSPELFAAAQVRQMRNWRAAGDAELPYPVILIRYESLPKHLAQLTVDLGVEPLPPTFRAAPAQADGPAFADAIRAWKAMPDYLHIPAVG